MGYANHWHGDTQRQRQTKDDRKKKSYSFELGEQNGPTANDILYYIHFESSMELAILHHKYGGPTHHPHRQSPLRPNCK